MFIYSVMNRYIMKTKEHENMKYVTTSNDDNTFIYYVILHKYNKE